ncbi:MAG TPA: tRNA (N6-isopentenyl adenosine(37)-C2)-methylthiotransferase MiaB [Pyrinomonadaceae bacterium]|nr:tRNA (N6-isopentenyl adenosine(37)-C2)-methylthiotransferase MiaB [Pyrinomonadaceae bacterium]
MKKNSVYIETFGCQMNVADSERAAGRLKHAGYEMSDSAERADVLIFNTCSVRAKAEQKVFNRIGEVRKSRGGSLPLLGVMGCVAQLEGGKIFEQSPLVGLVAGTRAYDRLPDLIERAAVGERRVLDLGERAATETWEVSAEDRGAGRVAFVPIIEGCNKFCTYCIVPYSRGREKSRRPSEVVEEVRRLKGEGFLEVQLIGQNVNSYRPSDEGGLEGFPGSTPFSRLLRAVAETGMARVKFTTSFPRDFREDIVRAIDEYDNLCNWVHLPVQSGSDRVLRAMRRGYKVADFMRHVEAIKASPRNIALTSDIIVGFPTETEEEFADTMRLAEECRFDGLYIFKYSERPGTPAARLPDDVPAGVKTERFLALERLQASVQASVYATYVGRLTEVLVNGASAKSEADLTGHTPCNKVVNFPGGRELTGSLVGVRILEAKANSLYGELV